MTPERTPERQLVESLAVPAARLAAMRSLLGAVNSRELRSVSVSDDALDAMIDGLSHHNSQVRWWCVQMLDHCADVRAVRAIVPLLDDPVPRVRRNAAHALGCNLCKPAWDGELQQSVSDRLAEMATSDPSPRVRTEAALALANHRRHRPHAGIACRGDNDA